MSDVGCRRKVAIKSPSLGDPCSLLFTDLSQSGWGVRLQVLTAVRTLASQEKEFYISVLEMKAIQLAIQCLPTSDHERETSLEEQRCHSRCTSGKWGARCLCYVQASSGGIYLVRAAYDYHHSQMHSQEWKWSGRPVMPFGLDTSHRMSSSEVQWHLQGVLPSSHHSVCHRDKHSAPHLCVTQPRPYGMEGGLF